MDDDTGLTDLEDPILITVEETVVSFDFKAHSALGDLNEEAMASIVEQIEEHLYEHFMYLASIRVGFSITGDGHE